MCALRAGRVGLHVSAVGPGRPPQPAHGARKLIIMQGVKKPWQEGTTNRQITITNSRSMTPPDVLCNSGRKFSPQYRSRNTQTNSVGFSVHYLGQVCRDTCERFQPSWSHDFPRTHLELGKLLHPSQRSISGRFQAGCFVPGLQEMVQRNGYVNVSKRSHNYYSGIGKQASQNRPLHPWTPRQYHAPIR